MEIKEYQKTIKKLLEDIDSEHPDKTHKNVETTFYHLIEELGEISRQLFNEKIGRDKLDKENLAEEIADCVMLLSQLATNFNIDLEEASKKKILKLKERFNID